MMLIRLLRHRLTILAATLLVLPHVTVAIGLTDSIATEIAIFALVGLGFNLLLGYTGLVSFGHGAFFGLAAYTAALIQIHFLGNGFLVPIVLAVVFAAVLGLVIGFLVLRRRGVYFALLTLAFTAMFFSVVFRWTSLTGGESGLGGITRPDLFGIDLDHQLVFYYFVAAIVFVVAWSIWRLVHSPFGRVLVAIRENEQRARFVGYPVRRYKLVTFVISTTIVGLGGSLFAFLKYFVSADLVHVVFSGEILAMSIIGGMRDFLGPPLGALFFILFREILSEYTAGWQFYFGLLFMAFILFSPTGLIGLGARIVAPFRREHERLAAMAARVKPVPAQAVPAFLKADNPTSGGEIVLECIDASKRFGDFAAVAGVDLRVHNNKLQALIGPNGAGKTTLFNVLSGMYPPETGRLILRGQEVSSRSADRLARRGVARSFQITNLFPELTVHENLRLAIQAHHGGRFNLWRPVDSFARVHEETHLLIDFLGLKGLESVPVSSLSYGGQRLMEIGLALAAKPRVLLLDEPLAGLAPAERERIVGLIQGLSKHMGVLVVEHDIDRVFAFAETITVMNNGTVLVEGSPETVRGHPEVQEVYLGSGRKVLVEQRQRARRPAGDVVLRLDGINTYYGSSHILHDVSLDVRDGEMVALLGRNGAGKSSTINSITGLTPPRSGEIHFKELSIAGKPPEDIALLGIGLVPQGRRLFPNLSVAENLAMGRLRRQSGEGVHWTDERIFGFFPQIKERLHNKADVLSGGEQQMVAIARALSGNVRLLLLDEPFEGLSPAMAEEVFHSIDQLRQEVAILIIEHDLDLALALSDRVYVLDRGYITHEGPAEPLLTDLEFRKETLWL
jgi:ABC-type branched-subunit amino acid transport system ATPase component/ABC-type branched-subunit amino acid transport system permease subunit